MNDAQTQTEALGAFFDERAPTYGSMLEQAQYSIPDWLVRRARSMKGMHILDLACGDGNLGQIFADHWEEPEIVGVDLSRKMIQAAVLRDIYRDLICADLGQGLPQRVLGQNYDAVIALGFLEFLSDPSALLKEVQALVNSDGRVWCSLEKSCEGSVRSGEIRPELGFAMHHHCREEAISIIQGAGLRLIEIHEYAAYTRSYDQERVMWWLIEAGV